MAKEEILEVRLFGAFSMQWEDGTPVYVSSIKARALIGLLCLAPAGTHSRAWLQECLWGRAHNQTDRINLRQALTKLRKEFGPRFDDVFTLTTADVAINLDRLRLLGDRRDGRLLEGIDIAESIFQGWLEDKREASTDLGPVLKQPLRRPEELLPSLAVLPLMAVSGADVESHGGDMIALEVIRALSRSKLMNVVSHLSSRQFQVRTISLGEVRESLQVDYVMSGTVRLSGSHVNLEAELLDAETGRILTSLPFETRLDDLLAGRSEMIRKLSNTIGQAVLSASVELAQNTPLPDVPAHALLMSSINLMHRPDIAPFARARRNLEALTSRLPTHSIPKAWLAKWYILAIAQNWSSDVSVDTLMAAKWANEALEANPTCSFSLAIDGMVQNQNIQQIDKARERFDDALEIDPNNAIAWLLKARLHSFTGSSADAVKCARQANLLSPVDPNRYFFQTITATAYLANNEPRKALDLANRSLASNRTHASTLRVKTIALEQLGEHHEAAQVAQSILKLEPSFCIEAYRKSHPATEFSIGGIWADALRSAGIPER
ncbi:MAG: hypothetical protein AAFY73_05780 [Pseudomonadota bacterium]